MVLEIFSAHILFLLLDLSPFLSSRFVIGRIAQLQERPTQPFCMHRWLHEGLSHANLQKFWSALWGLGLSRQISYLCVRVHLLDSKLRLRLPQPNLALSALDVGSTRQSLCVIVGGFAAPFIWWRGLFVCSFREWELSRAMPLGVSFAMPLGVSFAGFIHARGLEGEDTNPIFMLCSSGNSQRPLDMILLIARMGDSQSRHVVFYTLLALHCGSYGRLDARMYMETCIHLQMRHS